MAGGDDLRTTGQRVFGGALVPHGYTLSMWLAAIVVTGVVGTPRPRDALLFALGATTAFTLYGLLVHRSGRADVEAGPPRTTVAAALHALPLLLIFLVTALAAHTGPPALAWPLGGFLATTIFLTLDTAQMHWANSRPAGERDA